MYHVKVFLKEEFEHGCIVSEREARLVTFGTEVDNFLTTVVDSIMK